MASPNSFLAVACKIDCSQQVTLLHYSSWELTARGKTMHFNSRESVTKLMVVNLWLGGSLALVILITIMSQGATFLWIVTQWGHLLLFLEGLHHCKKGTNFNQPFAIWILVNILHAWTVNSAKRLVKNLKTHSSMQPPILLFPVQAWHFLYLCQLLWYSDWLHVCYFWFRWMSKCSAVDRGGVAQGQFAPGPQCKGPPKQCQFVSHIPV